MARFLCAVNIILLNSKEEKQETEDHCSTDRGPEGQPVEGEQGPIRDQGQADAKGPEIRHDPEDQETEAEHTDNADESRWEANDAVGETEEIDQQAIKIGKGRLARLIGERFIDPVLQQHIAVERHPRGVVIVSVR